MGPTGTVQGNGPEAVRGAGHGDRIEELARAAELDTDALLDLLSAGLARGPIATRDVSALTTSEMESLEAAGVDLSGPPAGVDPQVSTLGELARLLGESLDTDGAAISTRVSSGRIRQRLGARQLYGVRLGNAWRIPRWQFTPEGVVPGLDRIVPALPEDLHPLAVEHFMTAPHADLTIDDEAVSPVSWLVSGGDPLRVARLATALPAMS